MNNEKISLYDVISNAIVDGELPQDFSLPTEGTNEGVKFADGAMDGIIIYHMGHGDLKESSKELMDSIFHLITEDKFEDARKALKELSKECSAISAIDDFENYIFSNTEWINPQKLHAFGMDCIFDNTKEIVKYGMEILEVFQTSDDKIKSIIRTLGLSDEFTIFAVFHMLKWDNANEEIFALAKKVHGWGRIHAIDRLQPETEEIKDWLLYEGIHNGVVSAYSAMDCYEKAGVRELLKVLLSTKEVEAIADIIDALLDEGPVAGISAIDDAEELIMDFLNAAKSKELSINMCDIIYNIAEKFKDSEIEKKCNEILNSDKGKQTVTDAVKVGKGIRLAEYLGLEFKQDLFRNLEEDFEHNYYQCNYLVKDEKYRQSVIDLFMKKLPLQTMKSLPKKEMGLGKNFEQYNQLVFIVNQLANYPLEGIELVLAGIQSPIINNRNMAINVLKAWITKRNCTLAELSPTLDKALNEMKENEVDDGVKENLQKAGL